MNEEEKKAEEETTYDSSKTQILQITGTFKYNPTGKSISQAFEIDSSICTGSFKRYREAGEKEKKTPTWIFMKELGEGKVPVELLVGFALIGTDAMWKKWQEISGERLMVGLEGMPPGLLRALGIRR